VLFARARFLMREEREKNLKRKSIQRNIFRVSKCKQEKLSQTSNTKKKATKKKPRARISLSLSRSLFRFKRG